jgi:penicillin-binding protein 2
LPIIPQDSVSPPPPLPTDAPTTTPQPITDDASGIGRAFLRAWEGQDYLGMYSLLSPQSQALVDSLSFTNKYEQAMDTATVITIHTQPIGTLQEDANADFAVRVNFETAVVGSLSRDYTIPLVYSGGRWGVVWDEGLILPELAGGNRLFMDYRTPARANIYDINGLALAYMGNVISLGVIPGEIVDEEAMLAVLSQVLDKEPEEIQEKYIEYQPDWYAPVGVITEETMQAYASEIQSFIGAGLAPPQTRLARLYSDEGVAPHLIGYTGFIPAEQLAEYKAQGYQEDDTVGLAGLEAWGEEYLRGEQGGTLTVVGPSGEYITTIQEREPKQARSIYTTLDRDFQAGVEQILANALITLPGSRAGSIVVLDVNTGAVRAMASFPTYDPVIFDAVRPDSAVLLGEILSDPGNPLLNRAAQGAYPAGSTFKIVTMSAGLNSGLFTPNSLYTSTGTWSGLGENFIKRDWREGGHGTVTLIQALIVSCNSCFYNVGLTVDAYDQNFFPDTAKQFGIGQRTGIVGINENPGIAPSPQWKIENVGEGWVPGDAVNMAIGQGYVQVTPLQLTNIMAALANGGTLYRPTLVDRIGAGGGAPEEPWPTQVNSQLPLSPDNLAAIKEGLWQVANNQNLGTAAFQFVDLPVLVAGKTGTAEDPPRNTHAWFAGYAPAAPYTQPDGTVIEEPQIAIVVMVENGGEGSEVSAPIFRQIVELYFGITPIRPLPWQ